MIVYLHTGFVRAEEARVSVFDRGFLYGDSLFETIRVANGRLFQWVAHWERFAVGARELRIELPVSRDEAGGVARELLRRNDFAEGVLRVTLSRGVGARGYSPRGARQPAFMMWAHPLPAFEDGVVSGWKLCLATQRLASADRLGLLKTGNKLRQVMARAEAEAAGADEGLLLNEHGQVVEGAGSNIFWLRHDQVFTPPLSVGALPGITRAVVMRICRRERIPLAEKVVGVDELQKADGMFCTLSSLGVVEVVEFEGQASRRSELVRRLHGLYAREMRDETTE